MNMKKDLENEKLPVNEEITDNSLQPESAEKESIVELPHQETSPDEKPEAEKEVSVSATDEKVPAEEPEATPEEVPVETPENRPVEPAG